MMQRKRRSKRLMPRCKRMEKCQTCTELLDIFRPPWKSNSISLGTAEDVLSSSCPRHKNFFSDTISQIADNKELKEIRGFTLEDSSVLIYGVDQNGGIRGVLRIALLPSRRYTSLLTRGVLVHPHWIKPSLFRSWKETCECNHTETCGNFSISNHIMGSRPVFLVDVWLRCLVLALPSHKYVCLSYVWGPKNNFVASEGNLEELQRPGAFSTTRASSFLPKTILHAMAVVEMLQERYLWVDALCIPQDSTNLKHQEIYNMSGIFANAHVTIIAQNGEDVDSGILGLSGISPARTFNQNTWDLGTSARILEIPSLSDNHIWNTRGWTFQEEIFSRRRLIFNDDTVRWVCQDADWREDTTSSSKTHVNEDTTSSSKTHVNEDTTSSSKTHVNEDDLRPQRRFNSPIPDLENLRPLVVEYNKRDLTYPEDALYAFAGIFSALGSSFPGGFISGLPLAFFDIALLWQPWDDELTNRIPKISEAACLPSWSWAAWKGNLNLWTWDSAFYYNASKSMTRMRVAPNITPIVNWKYHRTPNAPGITIPKVFYESEKRYLNASEVECPDGWTRHRFRAATPMNKPSGLGANYKWIYRNTKVPDTDFWYPIPLAETDGIPVQENLIPAHYISCDTQRAWLTGAEQFSAFDGTAPCISLRDPGGKWVGALILNVSLNYHNGREQHIHSFEGQSLELIEIAKAEQIEEISNYYHFFYERGHPERPRPAEKYQYYYVLWIEWENGIAYRKGIGRVVQSSWEALKREKIHVMLG